MSNLCKRIHSIVMWSYLRAAAFAMFILVVATFVQVVGRYVLSASPGWSEEVARYAFIWCSALGAVCALDRGGHASITLMVDHMSPQPRRFLVISMTLVVAAVSVVVAIEGWNLAAATTRLSSPVLKIPMSYLNISICFCGIGMFVSSLNSFMNLFAKEQ